MTRDEHLQHAIRRLIREEQPITVETVSTRIPAVIAADLTDDEVVQAHAAVEGIELRAAPVLQVEPVERDLAELRHGPQGGTLAGPFGPKTSPRAAQVEPPHNPPANSMTEAEAVAAVKAAQQSLADCRNVVQARTRDLQSARGVLHDAIRAYIAGGEQFTPLDAARDFQATAQAQRKARADAGLHGTSATANAFLRKQMKNGGNMRGSFPSSWRGRTDPRFIPPESK
jgi:hypothetical protein